MFSGEKIGVHGDAMLSSVTLMILDSIVHFYSYIMAIHDNWRRHHLAARWGPVLDAIKMWPG
jgi:hypothetical protein